MKRKKNYTIQKLYTLAVIVGMTSILSFLYPYISDAWNNYVAYQMVNDYDKQVTDSSGETVDYVSMIEDAHKYNEELFSEGSNNISEYIARASGEKTEKQLAGDLQFPDAYYESFLSFNKEGMMGYITIPKINVLLPIKHYTSSDVLSTSIGHLYGSSLPVGGENTHAVLTGHSALTNYRLFTDLPKLEIGDFFTISVAGRNLNYQVDQIKTVLPDELEDLAIEEGKDYVTLVTCTPYAVNTHRLLVRGHRVADDIDISTNKNVLEKTQEIVKLPIVMFGIVALIFIIGIVLIVMIWRGKYEKKK